MTERGIVMELVWLDEDILEIRIAGSNGLFSGEARVYSGRDAFTKLADFARGFPGRPDERRLIELGTFDPGFAGGGARLGLRCLDRAGHVNLDVLLATQVEDNRHQRAEFHLEVEPAALDAFAAAVSALPIAKGASAHLPARIP